MLVQRGLSKPKDWKPMHYVIFCKEQSCQDFKKLKNLKERETSSGSIYNAHRVKKERCHCRGIDP